MDMREGNSAQSYHDFALVRRCSVILLNAPLLDVARSYGRLSADIGFSGAVEKGVGGAGMRYDFFVSRRGSAGAVAQEVADVLTGKGYAVVVQDDEIPFTANFIEAMHEAIKNSRDLVVEHPDTATSLNNLALLRQDQGDNSRARALNERALAIREKALGPRHPLAQPPILPAA